MMKKLTAAVSACLIALGGMLIPVPDENAAAPVSALSASALPGEVTFPGDCNSDGELNITDLVLMKHFMMGRNSFITLVNADMNADESIDVFDLALLKRELFGPTTKYKLDYVIMNNAEVHITGIQTLREGDTFNVVIPKKIDGLPVTFIGDYAFQNSEITSISIPDTVIGIGDYAFSDCPYLKTVYLSKNIESRFSGGYLFYKSVAIQKVYAPADMTDPTFIDHFNYHTDTIIEGTISDPMYTLTYQLPVADAKASITAYKSSNLPGICVTIPDTIFGRPVTAIDGWVFDASDICEAVLPDTLTSIGSWAFAGCKNLRKLTLSANLISDPEQNGCFARCNALTEVIVPENMADPLYIEELFNTPWGIEYFAAMIDEKVDEVYNALKAANPDIDWNIADAEGQARENAKYEVAKYIHSQLAGNLIVYNADIEYHETSYSLVRGFGACAGMARSYILLLLKAGFTPEEVQLIVAPWHALSGIQLYGQWYFVECTGNIPKFFGMTYQNEWYRGTPEGQYDGYYDDIDPYHYYFHYHQYCHEDEESEAYLADKYRSNYNRGDLNMDGVTDSTDYAALEVYLGGAAADFNLLNADVNYDGDINETDLAVLNSILTGETDLLSIMIPIYGEPLC